MSEPVDHQVYVNFDLNNVYSITLLYHEKIYPNQYFQLVLLLLLYF